MTNADGRECPSHGIQELNISMTDDIEAAAIQLTGHIEISGVRLYLSQPNESAGEWIGQREILMQLLACWLVVDEKDLPLAPRIVGTPGIGKTTLAISAGRTRQQDLYIYQCTADTRPEDLLVTPVLAESGRIKYHASPLVTAMVRGGIVILDEGNRMNEKSWASLAPLLDHCATSNRSWRGSRSTPTRIFAAPSP